jgi:hypothetical protein
MTGYDLGYDLRQFQVNRLLVQMYAMITTYYFRKIYRLITHRVRILLTKTKLCSSAKTRVD